MPRNAFVIRERCGDAWTEYFVQSYYDALPAVECAIAPHFITDDDNGEWAALVNEEAIEMLHAATAGMCPQIICGNTSITVTFERIAKRKSSF